jgi:predicted dehydrogenase
MEKIKTAVVGVGMFGDTHARTFYETEKADLVYVCDLNEERAKEVAKKYNCDYTTDFHEIANDKSIQVVSICTPDFAHREPSLIMIEAGKDLIIEKPLATNVKDAKDITIAAKQKGIRFMTDFQNRWNPPFVEAKQSILSGSLGNVVSAYIRLSNHKMITQWLSWTAQSGPQWFLGPHIVDLIRWLFGMEVRKVFASGSRGILAEEKGVDTWDSIQAQLIFDNAFATVDMSWIIPPSWPGLDFYFDLLGSEGKFQSEPTKSLSISTDQFKWPFISGRQDANGVMYGFFREPLLHFLDCVREDKPCLVAPDDGLVVTQIICAIEESLLSGKPVEII